MLSQADVLEAVRTGRSSDCLDGRDYGRLIDFFPVEQWEVFNFKVKKGAEAEVPDPRPWTEEEIRKQLQVDVEFGFEKALNCRGISSSFMHSVVKMWMWILEDPLQDCEDYAQYGLPLFKAVAVKYGFANPIGDDDGDERKYTEEGY